MESPQTVTWCAAAEQPFVCAVGVVERGWERMLRRQSVIRHHDGGLRRGRQRAGERAAAVGRAQDHPTAVEVQDRGPPTVVRRQRQAGDPAGVDRPHVDPFRHGEQRADGLIRGTCLVEVGDRGRGGELTHRRPRAGDPFHQLVADRASRRDGLVQVQQEITGAPEQRLTRQRQLDTAGGAAQQLAADQPFQASDLPAQRRLGQIQAGSGTPEVQLFGDSDERPQMPQLDRVRRPGKPQDVLLHAHTENCRARRAGPVMTVRHHTNVAAAFHTRPTARTCWTCTPTTDQPGR